MQQPALLNTKATINLDDWRSSNSSGYKYVHVEGPGRYRALPRLQDRTRNFGVFGTAEEAALMSAQACIAHRGAPAIPAEGSTPTFARKRAHVDRMTASCAGLPDGGDSCIRRASQARNSNNLDEPVKKAQRLGKDPKAKTRGPCCNCGAKETPQWRLGKKKQDLCNKCSLLFAAKSSQSAVTTSQMPLKRRSSVCNRKNHNPDCQCHLQRGTATVYAKETAQPDLGTCGQCERNPCCERGFKHGGRGGHCRMRKGAQGEGTGVCGAEKGQLVGRLVKKKFDDGVFSGRVGKYFAAHGWYLVEYEDGDREELTESEVRKVLVSDEGTVQAKHGRNDIKATQLEVERQRKEHAYWKEMKEKKEVRATQLDVEREHAYWKQREKQQAEAKRLEVERQRKGQAEVEEQKRHQEAEAAHLELNRQTKKQTKDEVTEHQCSACGEARGVAKFSKKQWKVGSTKRCIACVQRVIDADKERMQQMVKAKQLEANKQKEKQAADDAKWKQREHMPNRASQKSALLTRAVNRFPPQPTFGAPPLPNGWQRCVDMHHRTYYLDHNTQTSHWALPPENTLPMHHRLPNHQPCRYTHCVQSIQIADHPNPSYYHHTLDSAWCTRSYHNLYL